MIRFLHFGVVLFLLFTVVQAREYTNKELLLLPKLFYLDDYDRCLLREDGVYCLGKFEIYSDVDANSVYDFIQEYSQDKEHYNRTFLHRGYCLTTRCPSVERNVTARFERCVDQRARSHSLRTRLHTLHYCRSAHDSRIPTRIDAPRLVFLYAICFILLMNVVGTIYYFISEGKGEQNNSLLMVWSVPTNWHKYVTIRKYTDPLLRGLEGLEGIRVYIGFLIILLHTRLIQSRCYIFQARDNEEFLNSPISVSSGGLTTVGQFYVFTLCFLTTLPFLTASKNIQFEFKTLILLIINKAIRIWPMYIMGVAFAATWWVNMGDGPMWQFLVGSESDACRQKFWSHVFFVNNYFQEEKTCLIPTWVIAVEFQIYVFIVVLILALIKYKYFNIRVLFMLYAAAVMTTFFVAYKFSFKPTYKYNTPEDLFTKLVDNSSHKHFYIRPINCLIISIAGIILAYIHCNVKINEENKNVKKVLYWIHVSWLPSLHAWGCMAVIGKKITSPLVLAIILTLDRVIVSLIMVVGTYSSIRIEKGWMHKSGWQYLSRIMFGVSMIHCQISSYLMGISKNPIEAGTASLFVLGIAIFVLSAVVSLLLTIMFEYPMQKMLSQIFKKTKKVS